MKQKKQVIRKTELTLQKIIKNPLAMFFSKVSKWGNGAGIMAQKKYIGKEAFVVIIDKDKGE